MKYYGFTLGWISGMILQVIFFPFIINKQPMESHVWWTVQLIGLCISIIVWLFLDRKVIKAWLDRTDWNARIDALDKWLHS